QSGRADATAACERGAVSGSALRGGRGDRAGRAVPDGHRHFRSPAESSDPRRAHDAASDCHHHLFPSLSRGRLPHPVWRGGADPECQGDVLSDSADEPQGEGVLLAPLPVPRASPPDDSPRDVCGANQGRHPVTSAVRLSAAVMSSLRCPGCRSALALAEGELVCTVESCGARYPVVEGVPVLIDERRSIFRAADIAVELTDGRRRARRPGGLRALLRALTPSISLA